MIFKSLLMMIAFSVSSYSFAERYPVDDVIDGLRFKASHLEQLKKFLESNTCAMTVNGNKVLLGPGALRSEALVIGISPENPGNYNAFHKAPKPQFMRTVMASKDPRIIAVKFLFDQNDERVGLQFKIAKPVLVNPVDPFWHYMNSAFRMRLSDYGAEGKEHTFETDQGDKVTVSCKPKA